MIVEVKTNEQDDNLMTPIAWIIFSLAFFFYLVDFIKIMYVPQGTRSPKRSPLSVIWTHWAQSIKSLVYPRASKLLQTLLIEARSRLTNGCKEHFNKFLLLFYTSLFFSNGMNFKLGSAIDIYLGTDWIIQQAVRIHRFMHCVTVHILVSAKAYVSIYRYKKSWFYIHTVPLLFNLTASLWSQTIHCQSDNYNNQNVFITAFKSAIK